MEEEAITAVAEILSGTTRFPDGVRRRPLMTAAESVFYEEFRDRILAFDGDAAVEYAMLVVEREAAGLPVAMADAQIAAICRARECTVATRNVRNFDRTGVTVLDPWNDAGQRDHDSTHR